jgi:NitT/TauT family transport system permease protein
MHNLSSVLAHPEDPEYEVELEDTGEIGDVARPRSIWSRVASHEAFRRTAVLVMLAILWQALALWADNPLMLPSFTETMSAWWDITVSGELLQRVRASMEVLAIGYSTGIVVAACFASLAVLNRFAADVLSTLTAMFNPLPALAVLPLALLWFGLGVSSIVFVMVQSVVWAVSLNTITGFQTVAETQRMAGQNFGLRGMSFVFRLLVPAAFPSILTGLKLGWAFSWRTLIGAELVFGVSSRSGGLGWFIYENRAQLETPKVFAGLLTVILIGLLVETLVFRTVENLTVRRWGIAR